jgi:ABC-type nitrate/sulfonate/bicarbonate transport system substrate-binding protein
LLAPPPRRPGHLPSAGVLPILDALPLYVAEQQGYFAQHNVVVEFAGGPP